jgi:membrane protease YdiL (CAAX protease family)
MNAEASEVAAAPPAPPPGGAWSPLTVLWGMLAVLGVTVIGAAVVAAVDPDLDAETFGLIIQAVFAVALFAVPLLLISGPGQVLASPTRLGLRRFNVAQGIGWTFAAYGGFFVFLVIYGLIVQPDPQEIIEEIEQERETLKLVALGLLVVLAAPVSEEVFFRGFLFGGLRGRISFWPAAVISGLLFGLVHLPGGPLQVPPLAVFGILLAWLYERTGSLGPPILMHTIQNAISFSYTLSA